MDEWGEIVRSIYAESAHHYRYEGFALMEPTYVCECGMEWNVREDVAEHLSIFAPDEELTVT